MREDVWELHGFCGVCFKVSEKGDLQDFLRVFVGVFGIVWKGSTQVVVLGSTYEG